MLLLPPLLLLPPPGIIIADHRTAPPPPPPPILPSASASASSPELGGGGRITQYNLSATLRTEYAPTMPTGGLYHKQWKSVDRPRRSFEATAGRRERRRGGT